MTAPATPAPNAAPTHPCARCGAPVGLDVGLCERCNPLGLKDSASSQVHGTVFLAIGLSVVVLAILAHLAVGGIGPFTATVTGVKAGTSAGSVVATIAVHNDGRTIGSATCRIVDPSDGSVLNSLVIYSPRIEAGQTATWDQDVAFGSPGRPLDISCKGP